MVAFALPEGRFKHWRAHDDGPRESPYGCLERSSEWIDPHRSNYAACLPSRSCLNGDAPKACRVCTKSLISSANFGPSAEEIHFTRSRSSSMPLKASNCFKKRTRLSVE